MIEAFGLNFRHDVLPCGTVSSGRTASRHLTPKRVHAAAEQGCALREPEGKQLRRAEVQTETGKAAAAALTGNTESSFRSHRPHRGGRRSCDAAAELTAPGTAAGATQQTSAGKRTQSFHDAPVVGA